MVPRESAGPLLQGDRMDESELLRMRPLHPVNKGVVQGEQVIVPFHANPTNSVGSSATLHLWQLVFPLVKRQELAANAHEEHMRIQIRSPRKNR
jgi:hypothetical protein